MSKFVITADNEKQKSFHFHCPGCECSHWVRVRGLEPCWTVSGIEEDKPTVKPSIRVRDGQHVCHFFVCEGKIQFLNDCTHKLKGQTVEIPDYD